MLAKSLLAANKDDLTSTGELVGNMFYLAPERTVPGAPVDGRADLYSLGVTLYHAVTGRLPFHAKSLPELVAQIRQAAPDRPQRYQPDLPVAFEAILLRLLAKKPEQRPASAKELLAELENVAAAARLRV
jgi:serine/threonine protein kinase